MAFTFSNTGIVTDVTGNNPVTVSMNIGFYPSPWVIIATSRNSNSTVATLTVGGISATKIVDDSALGSGITDTIWLVKAVGLSGNQNVVLTETGGSSTARAFALWYSSDLSVTLANTVTGTTGQFQSNPTISVVKNQYLFACTASNPGAVFNFSGSTQTPTTDTCVAFFANFFVDASGWLIAATNASFLLQTTSPNNCPTAAATFTVVPAVPIAVTAFEPDFWESDFIQEYSYPAIQTLFQPDFVEPDFVQEFAFNPQTFIQTDFWEPDFAQELAAVSGLGLTGFEPGAFQPDFIEEYAYSPQTFVQTDFWETDYVQELAAVAGAFVTGFQTDAWEPDFIEEYAYSPQTFVETDAWEPDFVQELAAAGAITDLRNDWFVPLSDPVRVPSRPPYFDAFEVSQEPTDQMAMGWFASFREPVRTAARAPYFEAAPYFETAQFPETVTESRWHQPWSEPVRTLPRVPYFEAFSFDPKDFAPSMGWFLGWEPKPPPAPRSPELPAAPYFETQQFPETVTESRWHQPWSEPVRTWPPRAPYFEAFWYDPAPFVSPETINADKWFAQWRDPVRFLPRSPDFWATPYNESQQFPESVTEDRWHQPWSEPVRTKPRATDFPHGGVDPTPFTPSMGWFQAWREQPPPRPRSPDFWATPYFETAQFTETVTESRWHQPWSEPVRARPRAPDFPEPVWLFIAPPAISTSGILAVTERLDQFTGTGALLKRFGSMDVIEQRDRASGVGWTGSVNTGVSQTWPALPTR